MLDGKRLVEQARHASIPWAATPLNQRLAVARKIRREIASRPDYWVDVIRRDLGKPGLDALGGDVLPTLEIIKHYENHARSYLQDRKLPSGPLLWGNRFYESFRPYGVVLVISPWNYPLQLSLVPVITALVAGNAVILKPSEAAPNTARELRALLEGAGLPPGVFTCCEGEGHIGAALVDARPDFVFFTGSSGVGRSVAQRCASLLIPAALELGGKDVMIICRDADLPRAAKGAAYGAFVNSGQVCVGVKRILVHRDVRTEFLRLFKGEIARLRVGNDLHCDLGRLGSECEARRLERLVDESVAAGATVEATAPSKERFFYPTVVANAPAGSRLRTEETFGPVVLLDDFDSESEAVASANASEFGLSASVWSRDLRSAERIAKALVVGSCAVNNVIVQIANPAAPFGGERASGMGRYHGKEGLHLFSRRQMIMVNRGWLRREIHWFPFTGGTYRLLKKVIGWRHGRTWLPSSWAAE